MNENEFTTFEDKLYPNPQLGLDESNAFIENLRNIQAEDTARINKQTYDLGTQIPSNLGGLSGAETTFAERYQKPQTEQMIANLKTTAQQEALNQALKNTLAQYKQRYQKAYKNAQARAYANASAPTYGATGGDGLPYDLDILPEKDQVSISDTEVTVPSETSSSGIGNQVIDTATATSRITGGTKPYNVAGYPYYIIDKNGNATGVRIHSANRNLLGVDTPVTSFNAQGGENYLKSVISSGGRLYNANGVDVSSTWRLLL